MNSRRVSQSMRMFRFRWGLPGLILIVLGQIVQVAQARNLIVTQSNGNSSSGGIAGNTGNPTGTVSSMVAGGLTPSQAQAQAVQEVADMARAARLIVTQQRVQSVAQAAALTLPPATPVTNGLTTLGTPNPGLTPDSGLTVNQSAVVNPPLTPGTSTTYDVPPSWKGINGLSQTTSTSNGQTQTTVAINQQTTTAVLNWNTFSVGQNTTVQFNQSDASWVAFNKIQPSGVPSQILGSIQALGQVYIVNANGIIFSGTSQVNVHNLTASTLPINDTLVSQGLLNNPNFLFLFSALSDNADAAAQLPASGTVGNILVEPGAVLSAPTTADNVGGRVALIAPKVDNQGTISTPDGQTILAAGLQAGFIASSDPSVRGLDVYVGKVTDPSVTISPGSGSVSNEGIISAPRGNITLTGATIDQNGILSSTTSVAENGTIDLLAVYNDFVVTSANSPYFAYGSTGSVTFEPNSLTEILPEYDSTLTIAGQLVGNNPIAQQILQLPSQIVVMGQTINMVASTPDSAAEILAPNANLSLQAGTPDPLGVDTLDFADPVDCQLTIGANAIIDVAGSANVSASVANNIISVQLQGAELADSPLQRTGVLKGQTIKVDLGQTGTNADGTTWVGTPLANTLGYVNQEQYTVGELTTAGGNVTINSGGAVTMGQGSVVDVSGGYINYAGAEVQTTRLITNTGQILDISQANPNLIYDGIYTGSFSTTDPNLGITNTFSNPVATGAYYEPGYVRGGSGGNISIQAPAMTFTGVLSGQTVIGPRQLSGSIMPTASTLTLTAGEIADAAPAQFAGVNIFVQTDGSPVPAASAGFGTLSSLLLTPDLVNNDGFGSLTLTNTEGSITVEPGADLTIQGAGMLSMEASRITIDANITDPGGNLNFIVHQVSAFNAVVNGIPVPPTLDPNKGLFTLGDGDTLSTAGLVVDNRPDSSSAAMVPLLTAGGGITINSYSADLTGGTLDVSGGAIINPNSTVSFAGSAAGKIDIEAGQEPAANYLSVLGGTLNLTNTTFLGYSGVTGGSLTVKAPAIQVGGSQPANATTLWLQPAFFSQDGFSSYTMKGIGILNQQNIPAVLIAAGTQLTPTAQSWQSTFDAQANFSLTPTLLPTGQRNPVNLTFSALGVQDSFSSSSIALLRGDLVMSQGASIGTDPLGQVTLSGDTVTVLGSVSAPGGTIIISGDTNQSALQAAGLDVVVTTDLGLGSVLSAAGTVQQLYDKYGNLIGPVLAGGKITVSGDIDAETGSLINVSGATGTLSLQPAYSGVAYGTSIVTQQANTVIPTLVESNGGTLTFVNGPLPIVMESTLAGYAGGISTSGGQSTAQGGSLVISSQRQSNLPLPSDVSLVITPTETSTGAPAGISSVAASDITGKGFDAITLKGNVEFSGGATTLTAGASLLIASGGFLTVDSGSTANLQAPYVMLGRAFQTPVAQPPVYVFTLSDGVTPYYLNPADGTGVLNVTASDLIDVGNLSLQSVDVANFTSGNDIRGDGTLDLTGTLNLKAGQIYAPTATSFSIVAYNPAAGSGAVNIKWNNNQRALPYSAGSTLTILAAKISQDGVLNAPFGVINLGWNGAGSAPISIDQLSGATGNQLPITKILTLGPDSVTSVSAVDLLTGDALTIPYGVIFNGVSWIDPQGNDITLSGPPAKAVNLSASKVTDSTGAVVDVQGGGDLYAYQFIQGTGGSADFLSPTVSGDFTQGSYAVLPGYQANYAPYAPYNSNSSVSGNFATTVESADGPVAATDQGYANSKLTVGSQVYLGGGNGLAAGFYTLLPARYALLPGAFLVTPEANSPTINDAAVSQPGGSELVSGYAVNDLNTARSGQPLYTAFQVDPTPVVQTLAQYNQSFANGFFTQAAVANNLVVPRLPGDSGQLVLDATSALVLQQGAKVVSTPVDSTGLGGLVDIATSSNVFIYGAAESNQTVAGDLNLSVDELNSFGAASLLIGGIRQTGTSGTSVSVTTDKMEVDNAGDPLAGPEIILVTAPAKATSASDLVLDTGAEIEQTGNLTGSGGETLVIGDATNTGSGNGNVLWVTSNPSAQVERFGVSTQTPAPKLQIGANVTISAVSPVLDSTGQTLIDPTATIAGQNTTLGGSQITLWLSDTAPKTTGLFLTAQQLASLSAGGNLTLTSQTSIDIYGSGTIGSVSTLGNLSLHAAAIRGFDDQSGTITGGDSVTFAARNLTLDNEFNGTAPAANSNITPGGTLEFDARTLQLGGNSLQVVQYGSVVLNVSQDLLVQGMGNTASPGTFSTPGNMIITTPLITTAPLVPPAVATTFNPGTATTTLVPTESIAAGGTLDLEAPVAGTATTTSAGLGASLALSGASLTENTNIQLPSGSITLVATTGSVQVGNNHPGLIDAGGTEQTFNDLQEYTSGGQITLTADQGNIFVAAGSTISVAANPGGGNAGSLTVEAPNGQFVAAGTFEGAGGAPVNGVAGQNGSFSLDVASLVLDANNAPTLSALESSLADFTQSFDVRVRSGNIEVNGDLKGQSVTLSADQGSIVVDGTGTIDASYDTDPNYPYAPATTTGGSIDLAASGNVTIQGALTVEGQTFDDAGKGGSITLESGTPGVLAGAVTPGSGQIMIASGSTLNLAVDSSTSGSAAQGDFTGTLLLIAPQVDASGNPIAANNPNNVIPVGVAISSLKGNIIAPSSLVIVGNQYYQPANGAIDGEESAIMANGIAFVGAAGTTTTNYAAMFNGLLGNQPAAIQQVANLEPGAEIINPAGSLTLGSANSTPASDWNLATYRFGPNGAPGLLTLRAAGDLTLDNAISDGFDPASSSNLRDETLLTTSPVLPVNNQSWSYRLVAGSDVTAADVNQVLSMAALAALDPKYNPAKTGPQGSLQLGKPNPGGSISSDQIDSTYYQVIRTGSGAIDISTGGSVQLLNPFASIYTAGTQAPALNNFSLPTYNGNEATNVDAQYSFAGGNVTILAQDNIQHVTQTFIGQSIDTQLELPINWLERRGTTDSASATTSWWIDFGNFFEGVGALGGGNVSLVAGNNITNVDAVIPTNARMPIGSASSQDLVELGGGNLLVQAANNIDGGVYYIEQGQGTLIAGNSITTNAKRLPSAQIGAALPVTLFLGQGSFNLTAGGSINLGPVANPFLLPESVNGTANSAFFSTYATTDAVNVTSLSGSVGLAETTTNQISFLVSWMTYVDLNASQPWLSLNENNTTINNYQTASTLLPAALRVTALVGDIDLIGNLTLSPSPVGTIELAADGSINALQPLEGEGTPVWIPSAINLSDADPAAFPGVLAPITISDATLNGLDNLLLDTGSTGGSAQFKQSLHTPGGLHAGDPNPVRLYAQTGDISGLTLYSGKFSRIIAGQDITDVALYLQNNNTGDISIVSAGRDVIPYDPNSPLQTLANAAAVAQQNFTVQAQPGDLEIGGPGTLEVLAGRDLTLGDGPDNGDGTGVGITSIGNQRNPYLSSAGADVIAGAGIGVSDALTNNGLAGSPANFTDLVNHTGFIDQFLNPAYGGSEATTYLPEVGSALGLPSSTSDQDIWTAFAALSPEQQDALALNIFYQVLSDSGVAHNNPSSPTFGNYTTGEKAIAALFPGNAWQGDIGLSSREIKTENGGSIDLFAPGGNLALGSDTTKPPADQGILTDEGGAINIYTSNDVNLGASRIFTLRGGDVTVWSDKGNIAAGASSKTVAAAPPTRVLVDPQTGNVETDLAGLATGGGIGVLESKATVVASNVNLIAPVGIVDAGDAGIRVSGNLNIAAAHIVNAANISVGGTSSGVPTGSSVNVGGLLGASNAAGASDQAAQKLTNLGGTSDISVQVIGYGGG